MKQTKQELWRESQLKNNGDLGQFVKGENEMSEDKDEFKGTPITWDDVDTTGKYIKIEEGDTVEFVSINRSLSRVEKNFKDVAEMRDEFKTEIIELNGMELGEDNYKIFTTCSKRLLDGLKKVLAGRNDTDPIKLVISRLGNGAKTQYTVKVK